MLTTLRKAKIGCDRRGHAPNVFSSGTMASLLQPSRLDPAGHDQGQQALAGEVGILVQQSSRLYDGSVIPLHCCQAAN